MKALYMLLIFLLCSTSLHAEKVSILTELEMIQEKLWDLNRNMGAYKASLAEQQKQLGLLASGVAKERLELHERLTALTQATASQQERTEQMENALGSLGESLTALAAEAKQENSFLLDQAGKISALEGSLSALRAEFMTQETDTLQELADLRTQFTETRAQMVETRAQLDTLGQDVGGRVEQIVYWGAGAALILIVTLFIGIAWRRS